MVSLSCGYHNSYTDGRKDWVFAAQTASLGTTVWRPWQSPHALIILIQKELLSKAANCAQSWLMGTSNSAATLRLLLSYIIACEAVDHARHSCNVLAIAGWNRQGYLMAPTQHLDTH
jgi:hypothetical protein